MRTAVVTGAGAGLGRVIAQRFRDEGMTVIAVTRSDEHRQKLKASGFEAHSFDIGDLTLVDKFLDGLDGAPDIVVNNVGLSGPAVPIEEVTPAQWSETFAGNLDATIRIMSRVIPGMKARRSGSIVNISSTSVRTRPNSKAPYVVSKAAVEALSTMAARELAPYRVRCNVVRPGPLDNERLMRGLAKVAERRGVSLEATIEERLRFVGMRAKVDMADVAAMVCHLCSDESSFVTGQIIEVDGGVEWED